MGNAHTVAVANTHGHLNLQAFKPVMVYNIIDSITLLTEASSSFQSHCVAGIEADRQDRGTSATEPDAGYSTEQQDRVRQSRQSGKNRICREQDTETNICGGAWIPYCR